MGLRQDGKGINEELNDLLLAEVPEGYDRVRSDAKLTCVTGFTNYECLKEFNFVKKVIRNSGLEGVKKVNDAIKAYKDQNIEQVA